MTLAVVVAVAGCGDGGAAVPSEGPTLPPLGTYVPSGEGGDTGLLEGALVVRDGCLVIENDEGQLLTPVLPVDEVSWDGEELTWLGETYSPGDRMSLGGGVKTAISETVTIPAECESETYFMAYLH